MRPIRLIALPAILMLALLQAACKPVVVVDVSYGPAGERLHEFDRQRHTTAPDSPVLLAAADAAAARIAAHPDALINVPYREQPAFAEELTNRAGGLANCMSPESRLDRMTPNDVALLSIRSWSQDLPRLRPALELCRQKGSLLILFAPWEGKPADLHVDYLIDNGARDTPYISANTALVNAYNSWLWVCEYCAAMTRRGKYPGVLLTIAMPGSGPFDQRLQRPEGRTFVGDCRTAIPAGKLARAYAASVDALMAGMSAPYTQGQVTRAADLIAAQLRSGGKVVVSSNTHILPTEIFENRKTPMEPINVIGNSARAFPANAGPGDIILWISYLGLNTPYEDYAVGMHRSGARLITCYVTDPDPTNDAPDALAHIEQGWHPPDAVVGVPFPPGRIAPTSGLNQSLLYRMLEDEVAARLKK